MKISMKKNLVVFTMQDEKGIPLGLATLDESTGEIGNLLVDSEHRTRGMGSRLVIAAEAHAKTLNLIPIACVHTENIKARRLFSKLNYNMDRIQMVKEKR